MVANMYSDELAARLDIEKIVTKIIKGKIEQISMATLLREILLNHKVSGGMVNSFLNNCYVSDGLIEIVDGQIIKGKGK